MLILFYCSSTTLAGNLLVPSSEENSLALKIDLASQDPSSETLISRLDQQIKKAKKSIEIVTTCERLQYACFCFFESLSEAWIGKVKRPILIEEPSVELKEMFRKCYPLPWTDIRFSSKKPSTVVAVFDNNEVFVMTNSNAGWKDSPALWSNGSSILSLSRYYIETLWNESIPLEKISENEPFLSSYQM